MLIDGSKNFSEFELIDSGHGRRLERWGTLTLVRPDPQAIWKPSQDTTLWDAADAVFEHDVWKTKTTLPEQWELAFQSMKLIARPMSFKHTGIFPEQAHNWLWMHEQLKGLERPRVLNLFGYTGAATVWLTMQGAFVTHVDASRPALGWARENQRLNGLPEDAIRWMLEDAVAFVRKEVRRGAQYEGIVMDPPAFGHGPSGGMWKFNVHMPGLLESCVKLLSPEARFLLINAYATNSSELALQYVLQDAMGARHGNTDSGQLCLGQRDGRLVSVGIWSHWTK